MKTWIVAAAASASVLSAMPAQAIMSFPTGEPANNSTIPMVLDGVYTDASDLGAPPFASPAFTLEINLPTNVFISDPNPTTPEAFFIPGVISGSYEDGDVNEKFTGANLQVNQYNNAENLPVTDLQVDIYGVLTSSDYLYIYPELAGSLYTFSGDSTMASTMSARYIVPQGEAYYSGQNDPPFSGTANVGPPVSAAPEPAAWALMIAGVGLVGLAFRTATRRQEVASPI